MAASTASADPGPASVDAPRVVVTTDPELDDLNSMLHMLLYSDQINLVGLVYSASQHHYTGDESLGLASKRWPAEGARLHIDQALDAYAEVYSNLVKHSATYPNPTYLRSLVRMGNVVTVGDMSEDTPGSDLIKQILLDDEPGQVFLEVWGGPNTIARALKSIEDEYKGTPQWQAIYDKIVAKAVITSFGQQDTTFREYIKPNWPEIENREVATSIWGYGARGAVQADAAATLEPEWMNANVSSVGPMGRAYRVWGDGKQMAAGFDAEDYFGLSGYTSAELRDMGYQVWTAPQAKGAWISEGDSSNWALMVDNGLRNWVDPSWGGWGGRQAVSATDPVSWTNANARDTLPNGTATSSYSSARWWSAVQNDFAARMKWGVTNSYAAANHEPVVDVAEGIDLVARPAQVVDLTAVLSDPDGDAVSAKWWQYREAGTYPGAVALTSATGETTSLQIPSDAVPGQTIHVILEATDSGTPALTRYQRVVITVAQPADASGIPVVAEVPELGTQDGSLMMTVADFGDAVDLGVGAYVGERLQFKGELPAVKVTDTRSAAQAGTGGWTVAGRSSSFISASDEISSAYLGWTPWLERGRDGLVAGAAVLGALDGGAGLNEVATLAEATTVGRLGVATAHADLLFEIPVDTADGQYEARLSVSLFPVD